MNMRTLMALWSLMFLCGTTVLAQNTEKDKSVFNHLAATVGVGTEGVGIGVATTCTDYLEFGFDVNIVPAIKIKADLSVSSITAGSDGSTNLDFREVSVDGSFARTTCNFKANCYPFGRRSSFFVAAGFSFGGATLLSLGGHSDEIKGLLAKNPSMKGQLVGEIDKYNVPFDVNGDLVGDVRVNAFRPYFGLGFGRLVPKRRVGCRFELGCQLMGKAKIYQDGQLVKTDESDDVNDDISKIVEKITIYPVLKFSIATRIL
uniref:PorT family protein n=3 Tax=unclassified Prevotella TaxID=2638335 RepID=A0AB33J779_9BACT